MCDHATNLCLIDQDSSDQTFYLTIMWVGYGYIQCCGSGSESGGSIYFWASPIRIHWSEKRIRILLRTRILLSLSKNSKKNIDSYCFVTFMTSYL
jgi:hypothetical protein